MAKKRKKIYLLIYVGKQKDLRVAGVGRITIGEEYEVSEKIANAFRLTEKDWQVKTKYKYVEID